LIFEYFDSLVDELIDLEDGVFLLVHILYEPLHEGSQFLSSRDDVSFLHLEVKMILVL